MERTILFLTAVGSIGLNIYLIKYFIKCSCSASDLTIPFVNKPDVNPDRIWLHLKQSSIQACFVFREQPWKKGGDGMCCFYKAHYRAAKVKGMALKYLA